MIKKIIGSIIFLGGLVLILFFSSKVLAPKEEVYNAGEYNRKVKELFYEADNSIDVVFAGDSEVYSGYTPLHMYNEEGFTSYVLGTYGQRLCDTYALLKKMYEKQSPSLVVIETNCFFRFGGLADDTSDKFMNFVLKYIPAMKYHSRIKMKFLRPDSKNEALMKGFIYRNDTIAYKGGKWMHETDRIEEIDRENIAYLDKIVEMAKSRGSEVIFVTTPSPDCHSYEKHNAINKLADNLNVTYYDFNFDAEEIGIDWDKDTRDAGNHLNYKGACKLSSYVAKLLSEKYSLPDHREDENFSKWINDYNVYLSLVEK